MQLISTKLPKLLPKEILKALAGGNEIQILSIKNKKNLEVPVIEKHLSWKYKKYRF